MSKRNLIIGLGAIALAIAWYAFRPELLFINKIGQRGAAGRPADIDGDVKRDGAHGPGKGRLPRARPRD